MAKIPIIICIDVEPDGREKEIKLPKDWEGFENACDIFNRVRSRIEAVTGAPANFSWFFRMDPQIKSTYGSHDWVSRRYGDAIKQLERSGDELGLHTHLWRWNDSLLRWVIDQADQKWVEHCVQVAFKAFQNAFGRPCRSFRFGERWMNNETMNLLESMGVNFELTLEPGRSSRSTIPPWEVWTGSFPDHTTAPSRPYKPCQDDYRKDNGGRKRGLWLIPLSTEKEPGRFQGLKQAAMGLGYDYRKNHEPIPLALDLDVKQFRPMINNLIELKGQSYLAPVLRSDSCLAPKSRASLEQNLNLLLSHPQARDFQFVTPAEAIAILTRQNILDEAAPARC